MHLLAARKIVELCQRREAAGDCPTEPPMSVEMLEDCVLTLAQQLVATARDGERLDAIEAGKVQLECMGTDVRYFNAWGDDGRIFTDDGQIFTTAGGTMTLREAIDAAAARSTGSVGNG